MAWAVVFRGSANSAHVIAGFLRANGIRLVDVVPPTPYPAGPLGQGFVRVGERREEARELVSEGQSMPTLRGVPLPLTARLVAIFLLMNYFLFVPVGAQTLRDLINSVASEDLFGNLDLARSGHLYILDLKQPHRVRVNVPVVRIVMEVNRHPPPR